MRGLALVGLLWLSFASLVFSWTKEDHEIFDLVQALEDAEGKGMTFYSLLGVPSTATTAEIGKAYRKKSLTMHPDKNPGVKDIAERYARLGVIAKILRTEEDRTRYDFFYKNGVPKWRGTGYYYARFRPGLGSVLVFLGLITSLVQHGSAHINRQRDLARIARLQKNAKAIAYGPRAVPFEKGTKRKVRVPLSGADPSEDTRGMRMIDLMVDGQDVYVVSGSGAHDIVPLDESMAPAPLLMDTWVISLARQAFASLPLSKSPKTSASEAGVAGDLPEDDLTDGFMSESAAESSDAGTGKSRKSTGVKKRKGPARK